VNVLSRVAQASAWDRDKYVPVRQPIAKRAPDGLNLVRLTWIICRKWNSEFFPDLEEGK